MRHAHRLLVIFPLLCTNPLGLLESSAQQTAGQLYEQGLYLEEGKGELKDAIGLYSKIIERYPKDRAIAAKALLHLGLCHEKLGQEEALRAYRRLIKEYTEQSQEVKIARRRLAVLTKTSAPREANFRRIRVPTALPFRGSGRLSPDGQKLAFVSEGCLWTIPVHGNSDPEIAGTPARLTEPMHAWDVANVSVEWSGDGKWIGFRVAAPKLDADSKTEEELYVIPAQGGQPERLPITWKDWALDVFTLRYAISREASTIYYADGSKREELRTYKMDTKSGEKEPITEPITRQPALSPDGSTLAYVKIHLLPDGNPASQEVWMKQLRGGEPVLVCRVTGKNWLLSPVWSPDGGRIAFLSSVDRGGNRHHQVWVVPVVPGKEPDSPSKFELPGQTANLLAGWTQDNSIGILVPTEQKRHLYTVPASGGKATQLTTAYTCMPVWAPDNKRIYFDGTHGGSYANLEYVAAEGGNVSRLPVLPENLQPVFPSELSISRDGRRLLFAGFYRSGNAEPAGRLFTVSTDGGVVVPIRHGDESLVRGAKSPGWSPDERRIAFVAEEEVKPGLDMQNIYVIPAAGGDPRRISSREDQVASTTLAWSPDGESIAFYGADTTLRVISADGGKSRVLVSAVGGGLPWSGIAWSPDGKRIAYTAGGSLQVVSRNGGTPESIETGLDARHLKIDWSNDGNHIAFTASQGGEPELWLMDKFLPE